MTEAITRVAGDDSKSAALEGTARCAVLPSTDNVSRLSSVNSLQDLASLGKRKERPRKMSARCFFLFFHFQKLGLAEDGGC